MSEVRYSVNGKLFKDFVVYVSKSKGIADELKRKAVTSYDWAEYHGTAVDLSRPKYESRNIELSCWIRGDNWGVMHSQFLAFMAEFRNTGTQRLLIEPFGHKPMPYEVYNPDDVNLDKVFSEGVMYGVFTLKLVEPNPIKKVLKVTDDFFTLSFNSEYETEVFWGDGTKAVFHGNVTVSKDYDYPSYQASGISIVGAEQSVLGFEYYQTSTQTKLEYYLFSTDVNFTTPKNIVLYLIGKKLDDSYELINSAGLSVSSGVNNLKIIAKINPSQWKRFVMKVTDEAGNDMALDYENVKMEKVVINGNWYDVRGTEKLVVIAGNIEDISDLETTATELWTRL